MAIKFPFGLNPPGHSWNRTSADSGYLLLRLFRREPTASREGGWISCNCTRAGQPMQFRDRKIWVIPSSTTPAGMVKPFGLPKPYSTRPFPPPRARVGVGLRGELLEEHRGSTPLAIRGTEWWRTAVFEPSGRAQAKDLPWPAKAMHGLTKPSKTRALFLWFHGPWFMPAVGVSAGVDWRLGSLCWVS